jgi:flagellar M-ring protein FliF
VKALGNLISDRSTMSITLWYGKTVQSADNLTTDYLNDVKQRASSATGIPAQNIMVSVQKLVPETTPAVKLTDTLMQLLDKYGFYALMLILLIIMVLTAMPKKRAVPALEAAAAEAAIAADGTSVGAVRPLKEEIKDINVEEQSELKKQIEKFVQQNPDAVAQLLRNWIADDWD